MSVLSKLSKLAACLVILVMSGTNTRAQNTQTHTQSNSDCQKCHGDHKYSALYNSSVHKSLQCAACHIEDHTKAPFAAEGTDKKCVASFKPTQCVSCHSSVVNDHEKSVHNSKRLPITCAKCHSEIHGLRSIKNDKIATAQLCTQCHDKQSSFFESSHFKAIKEGSKDAPGCVDCHGLHAIDRIDNVQQGRMFHTQACLKCHADADKMARNKVTTIAPISYFESYHGKNVRLGHPEQVAGCSDCHESHKILPKDDPHSSIHPNNLTTTCRQCHKDAGNGFAKYLPHAEPGNRQANPLLFWVTISMNGLLAGTFLFFWLHSLLWMYRGFVEKKHLANAALFGGAATEVTKQHAAQKVYRRFRPIHIILHIFVITSFLTLAITGLPLKFNETQWGHALMDLLGGVASAGLIHRLAAVVTFGYFFVTLGMSIRFLITKRAPKETMLQRLFGPDSLFPNRRDLRDMIAMFKWFFFKGPKPTFDRWTYWEKFDFLAVFWGVGVIGSSGLILWMPEFFGGFLPGWVFNVATIIHSDEALLAVGFIFTIHFFNTHLRVEKFPMDFVIFNGQISEEEMRHERMDQWKRYNETGNTKDYVVTKPTPLPVEIGLRLFGFAAVVVGTVLALLILYTIF